MAKLTNSIVYQVSDIKYKTQPTTETIKILTFQKHPEWVFPTGTSETLRNKGDSWETAGISKYLSKNPPEETPNGNSRAL